MAPFSASSVPASVFLNPLVWFLWLLDFAFWLLLPPWNLLKFILQIFKGKVSYEMPSSDGVRHKKGIKQLLETPFEGCATVNCVERVLEVEFENYLCVVSRVALTPLTHRVHRAVSSQGGTNSYSAGPEVLLSSILGLGTQNFSHQATDNFTDRYGSEAPDFLPQGHK